MNAKKLATVFLAAALLCAGASPALAKPSKGWTITSLGGEYAATVNNRGDIGGFSRVQLPPDAFPPHVEHAVIWRNGVMQDLGANFGTPPGQASSTVAAVNDRGTFVLKTPDGVMTFRDGLMTPLGFSGAPTAINNRGAIVGSLATATGSTPFLYRDGMVRDLGTLGGAQAQANAVNDRGTVVGFSFLAHGFQMRPFIYQDGVMKGLGTFGGDLGAASGINNHGVVVGQAQDPSGRFIAFMTDESGVLRPFLNLPGGQSAAAINQRGDIVGSVNGKGYLYSDGKVTILDDLPGVKEGWWFLVPTAINNRGWIVGTGNRRGGAFTGEGFVLVPR
jgi:probable HAF family extracellular repeat protein